MLLMMSFLYDMTSHFTSIIKKIYGRLRMFDRFRLVKFSHNYKINVETSKSNQSHSLCLPKIYADFTHRILVPKRSVFRGYCLIILLNDWRVRDFFNYFFIFVYFNVFNDRESFFTAVSTLLFPQNAHNGYFLVGVHMITWSLYLKN